MKKLAGSIGWLAICLFPAFLVGCSQDSACVPHEGKYCDEGVLYWMDSCGNYEEQIEQCDCGCNSEHSGCKSPCDCIPNCTGKCCGDDGCRGTCPDNCGAGQECNPAACTCRSICTPHNCVDQGKECGQWDDGCGHGLDCGNCPEGYLCSATGRCEVACPGGRTSCDDECVDTSSDPRHCGGCGQACGSGQICENSGCVTGPDCRQTPCSGFTYCDLNTGNCVPGCIEDSQCSENEHCVITTHECECDTGTHRCSGACVFDDSPEHCGTLCTPCPRDSHGTSSCENGQCMLRCDSGYIKCDDSCVYCNDPRGTPRCGPGGECVLDCEAGYHQCLDSCVSNDSTDHCGTRCDPCPTDPNGTARCTIGQCQIACDSGFILCNDQCIQCSDPHGSVSCSPTGACQISCDFGYHLCSGACVSNSSTEHCGSSCTPCPDDPDGYPTCNGWSCGIECHSQYIYCGGSCTHCYDSHGTPSCSDGSCVITCDNDYHLCSGSCVSDDSVDHCGPLCTPCPNPDPHGVAACINELCSISCDSGYVLCGGSCIECYDPHGTPGCSPTGGCQITCDSGYHMCSGSCVSDFDVDHCGTRCTPCPSVPNGTPTCDGTDCSISCDTGYIYCGGACIACADPHGTASCGPGNDCVITCDSAYHLCSDACVSDFDTNNCGTSCTPCPSDPYGTETCDGTNCGITCDFGYRMCQGACALCPGTDGVETFECSGSECIITECQIGWYMCGDICCEWTIETIYSGDASWASMEFDSLGAPHVSFKGDSGALMYAHWTGNAWDVQTAETGCYGATSISVDANNHPHIVYQSNGYNVKYVHWDGTAWQKDTAYSSSTGYGPAVGTRSIALDSAGNPHVAIYQLIYQSGSYRTYIVHAWKDAGSWDYRYATVYSNTSSPTCIMDADDLFHLSWIEYTDEALTYATITGTDWNFESAHAQAYCCGDSFVTLDANGIPFISFEVDSDDYAYASRETGSWQAQTLQTGIRDVGNLLVDQSGQLHWIYSITSGTDVILVYTEPDGASGTMHQLIGDVHDFQMILDNTDAAYFICSTGSGLKYIHR